MTGPAQRSVRVLITCMCLWAERVGIQSADLHNGDTSTVTMPFPPTLTYMTHNNSRLRLTLSDLAQCTQTNQTVSMYVDHGDEITVEYSQRQAEPEDKAPHNPPLPPFSCWFNVTSSEDHVMKIHFRQQTCSQDNFLSVIVQVNDTSEVKDRRTGCEDLRSPLLMDWVSRRHFAVFAIIVHDLQLSYSLQLKVVSVTSAAKKQVQFHYMSSRMGLLQSPSWNPAAGVAYPTFAGDFSSQVEILMSSDHMMMNSFLYVNFGQYFLLYFLLTPLSPGSRLCNLDRTRTCSKKGYYKQGQSPLAPFIFPHHPAPVVIRFSTTLTHPPHPGFRLLYTFHQTSKKPMEIVEGVWNCSVDSWRRFQPHLACNRMTQCLDGRDEEDCGYTRCHGVGFEVQGRCYSLRYQPKFQDFRAMRRQCVTEGAELASLNTVQEYQEVTSALWTYQQFPMVVGFSSSSGEFPIMYRAISMWEDRTIAYTVRYLRHRLSGNIETFPLCGVLNAEPPEKMADNNAYRSANRWVNPFEMFACSFRSNPFLPFLCEYSEQPFPRSFQHTASLTLAKLGMEPSPGLTLCPSNHTVHDFLTCDSLSHCWALQPLSFGDSPESWDIPSARTCPVVMTSLPPSYECQRGGQRVPYSLVCDHRQDCVDSSDEDFCGYTSRPGQIRCGRGKQSYQPSRRCDAQKDCVHGGDEMLCDNYSLMCANNHVLPPPSPPAVVTFTAKCYTVSKMSETHSASGQVSCPDTHYQCPQGYCLPVFTRCNGVYDCPHWQDEAGCEHYQCPGYYRCRGSSVCVHPTHICDGVNHCPQSDDELLCDLHCPSVCTCYGLAFMCPQMFPVEQYEDLRYLKARGSGMTMEQLSSNMMLVYLSLADCQVSAIGNVSFPNMATLDLSDNDITSLTSIVYEIPHLKALFLSNNPLSNFLYRNHLQREAFTYPPCQISTSVEVLVLSGIELQTLNDRIGHLFPSAQRLNVSGCGTQRVTQQALQLMSQLQELDMAGCPMEDIQENILRDLTHLTSVRGDNYKLCCAAGLLEGFNLNNCYAPRDEISSCSDLLRSNVYRIVLALLASLAILGNVVSGVFRMVTVQQGGAAGFSVFVVHLCGSDLLMGLYLAVIGMADRMYQDIYVWEDVSWRHSVVCQLAGFMSLVSSEVSAFIICLITLDRLLVVRFPLSFLRFQGSHASLASTACWFMGILLAAVPFSPFTTHWEFYSQTGICIPLPVTRKQFAGHQYALAVMVVINSTLFLIIALGQTAVFHSVRANQMIGAQTGQSSQDAHIARRLFTIAMSDFLCWFPIGLTGLLASQGVPVSGEVNVAIAVLVLPLNSAINPFLYTLNVLIEKQHKAKEDKLLRWIQSQS